MGNLDDQNKKIRELIELNNTRKKLSDEIKSKIDSSRHPITQHDDYFLHFIESRNEDVNNYISVIFDKDDSEEFDKEFLSIKFRLDTTINELKIILNKLNNPIKEHIKLTNILKEILKSLKKT